MKENRTKVVSSGFTISIYLTMQQRRQKTQLSNAVYCYKLGTTEANSQKHTNKPRLHPKIIGLPIESFVN